MAQGETEEALELLREASLLDPENRVGIDEEKYFSLSFLSMNFKCSLKKSSLSTLEW